MKRNNFFMAMLFGIITLLGTSFEVRSSENNSLTPYVIGTTVVIGAGLLAVTQTATYQTYSEHKARLAEEKEKSDNPFRYAESLSGKRSSSEILIMSDKARAFFENYEKQRNVEAQKFATKITEKTLPSHMIDDYEGEGRK
jgi:hypothetical protein